MATRSASARLRKTFQYPSSDDSLSEPDELDEEHQEKLIHDLALSDAAKNALYRKIFLALPLFAILVALYSFTTTASGARGRLLALLSATSCACSAHLLHFLPIEKVERKGKVPQYRVDAAKGPVERYLPWLNGLLVGLLGLASLLSFRRGNVEDAWREALPGLIFGIILFARQLLAPLDLEELQRARYDLKGA